MRVLTYPTSEFPLVERLSAALGDTDLSRLHELPETEAMGWRDAMRHWASRVGEAFQADGVEVYDELVHWVLGRLGLDHALPYQRPPNFRVHLVGAPTASALHRDRDHTSSDRYLNVWVPLVDVGGANSLLVERPGGSLRAQSLRHGQALCFNGRDLLHGSSVNTTLTTRVSFDCRVIGVDPTAYS